MTFHKEGVGTQFGRKSRGFLVEMGMCCDLSCGVDYLLP